MQNIGKWAFKEPIMHCKNSFTSSVTESIHTHYSIAMQKKGIPRIWQDCCYISPFQCCNALMKMKFLLTQQIGPFIHIPYEPGACRRQLFKQRVCIAVKCHVLNAFSRGARRVMRTGGDVMLPGEMLFKTGLTAGSLYYLQGLYPMRSMSSSGVDSMMSCTSELSSFSGKPAQHTAHEYQEEERILSKSTSFWIRLGSF